MLKNYSSIAAISSPPGKGGVAIIRVSGEDALELVSTVFHPVNKKSFLEAKPRMQIYGYIMDGGERIDDCLATYFPAPHSYTGENIVEIGCHGGVLVTSLVLETILKAGARHAEAGEFTRRAFINGKLSLTEAEAIGNLLEAQSREQVKLSGSKSRRALTDAISEIRADLVSLMSSIYARIDYPDEDLGDFTDSEAGEIISATLKKAVTLRETYRTGRAIGEGISAVIVGKPNVGKSSLYNAILGEDSAIVTSIAGTTRDVLSERIPLGKIMLRLSDTAGIRDTNEADTVESIGIEKSRKKLHECELIFAIFDSSREFDEEDHQLLSEIKKAPGTKIAIINKCDLEEKFDEKNLEGIFCHTLHLSAKCAPAHSINKTLSDLVNSLFTDEKIEIGSGAVISSARQNASLSRAIEAMEIALRNLSAGFPQDLVSGDIEQALEAISELDGRSVSEEIVADIFSKFCVGK
jgi:tRNA modification GTPase